MYAVGLPPGWDVSLALLDEASSPFEFAVAFCFCGLVGEVGATSLLFELAVVLKLHSPKRVSEHPFYREDMAK